MLNLYRKNNIWRKNNFRCLVKVNCFHSKPVLLVLPSRMFHFGFHNLIYTNEYVFQQSCVVICSIENAWNHGSNHGRTVQIVDLLPDSRMSLRSFILITRYRFDPLLNEPKKLTESVGDRWRLWMGRFFRRWRDAKYHYSNEFFMKNNHILLIIL